MIERGVTVTAFLLVLLSLPKAFTFSTVLRSVFLFYFFFGISIHYYKDNTIVIDVVLRPCKSFRLGLCGLWSLCGSSFKK